MMRQEKNLHNEYVEDKRMKLASVIKRMHCSEQEKIARLRHIGCLPEIINNANINSSLPETATGQHSSDEGLDKVA